MSGLRGHCALCDQWLGEEEARGQVIKKQGGDDAGDCVISKRKKDAGKWEGRAPEAV